MYLQNIEEDFSISTNLRPELLDENEYYQIFRVPEEPEFRNTKNAFLEAVYNENAIKDDGREVLYQSTDSALLNFFVLVNGDPNDWKVNAKHLLQQAWKENGQDTIKLVANLGDIRNGKGNKAFFFKCLYLMYVHHPKSLLRNLRNFVEIGCWKDLLQVIIFAAFEKVPEEIYNSTSKLSRKVIRYKKTRESARHIYSNVYELNKKVFDHYNEDWIRDEYNKLKKKRKAKEEKKAQAHSSTCCPCHAKPKNIPFLKKTPEERSANEIPKSDMKQFRLNYARFKFLSDIKYRHFHLTVAKMFAEQLFEDLKKFKKGEKKGISLAAKWAPSLKCHFDRYTLISTSIALYLVQIVEQNLEEMREYFDLKWMENLDNKPIPVAVCLARKFYHKQFLVPLREALNITESLMCAGKFDEINFNNCPSVCLQTHKKEFSQNCKEKFKNYLEHKKSIQGGALSVEKIMNELDELRSETDKEIQEMRQSLLEKQWISLCSKVQSSSLGSLLESSVCVMDKTLLNGQMNGMLGMIALTLNMTKFPWNELCLILSDKVTPVRIHRSWSLQKQMETLQQSMSRAVRPKVREIASFLIRVANQNNLSANDLPRNLIIFTQNTMDKLCEYKGNPQTLFDYMKQKLKDEGFRLPRIIFWMMNTADNFPIENSNYPNVVLLKGCSKNLLTYLMESSSLESITPQNFLRHVIDKEQYASFYAVD